MLHSPAFAIERKGFLERPCAFQPGFDAMSLLKKVEIMLGSDSTKLLNPHEYRYLALFFLLTPAPVAAFNCCEFRLCGGGAAA